MRSAFFFYLALTFSTVAQAALYSVSAGRVGDLVITSREVMVHHLLELALTSTSSQDINPKIRLSKPYEREYIREATGVLVEAAVNFEAVSFQAVAVPPSELAREKSRVLAKLKKLPQWQELKVETHELNQALERKLRAKNFIRFKIDSSRIPISDREAREYFETHRLKFENLPYEQFADNIKAYLAKQQMDRRLKDWFELLQTKYRVRNLLAE